ncbi:acyl carrier protein [Streptomyces sp. V2I9]|uniref:acyl carrier protein n=1 Tax=unclassified Streptomyces TaxID=2593676 RepID=UPI00278257EF|nr:acyl carrier protein [Streptomyces sp. V2I9]MDQ0988765.1 acyl carrier protein [Streptomyces sp. V2I9]
MSVREEDVSRIWAEVIGIPEADIHTNFFDLGGHSLQLMELSARLSEELGVDADVLVLMEHPTVAACTAHWNAREPAGEQDFTGSRS